MTKRLFLIPNYNHPDTIGAVVQSCLPHEGDRAPTDGGSLVLKIQRDINPVFCFKCSHGIRPPPCQMAT